MEKYQYTEDKLSLRNYTTSESLKSEIEQRIEKRKTTNWDFVKLDSSGAFISIVFKQLLG